MTLTGRKQFLAIFIAAAFLTSPALAKPGKGKGGGDPDPPKQTSCAAHDSEFPSFAFTKVSYSRKGSVEGHDIYLSNADGTCFVLLAALSGVSSIDLDLKYWQSGATGRVVWRQGVDESKRARFSDYRHDLIKLVRFETQNKEITSTEVFTAKNSGDPDVEYNSIDLSSDGQVVLVKEDSPNSSGVYFTSIHTNGHCRMLFELSNADNLYGKHG